MSHIGSRNVLAVKTILEFRDVAIHLLLRSVCHQSYIEYPFRLAMKSKVQTVTLTLRHEFYGVDTKLKAQTHYLPL